MNRESILLAAVAAAAGFAAGVLLSPSLSSRPRDSSKTNFPPSADGAANPGASRRALPFDPNFVPRSTGELIAAIEEARSRPHAQGRIYWLAAQLTPANAKEVIEALAKGSKPGGLNYDTTFELFSSWAQQDPLGALEFARALPDKNMQAPAIAGALGRWAESNPASAADWVEKFSPDSIEGAAGQEILEPLAAVDPERALRLAARGTDDIQTAQILQPALADLAKRDPHVAAAMVMNLPSGRFRGNALAAVARTWGRADPAAALAWITTWPEGHPSSVMQEFSRPPADAATEEVLGDWVTDDFDRALAWIEAHPAMTAKRIHIGQLATAAVRTSPANAVRLAALEPAGKQRDSALQEIARTWAGMDPDAALAWAETQVDAEKRSALAQIVVSSAAGNDAQKAASLAAKLPGDQQRVALTEIALTMAYRNPAAAAAWTDTFPDANLRNELQQAVIYEWARQDPVAAQQRFLGLPPGDARDELAGRLCWLLDSDEPKLVAQLINSLQDPAKRASWTEQIAEKWMSSDPGAGRAWIANSNLPADVRTRLLATPPDSNNSDHSNDSDLLPAPREY